MKTIKILTLITITLLTISHVTIVNAETPVTQPTENKEVKAGCNKCGARRKARQQAKLAALKAAREKKLSQK